MASVIRLTFALLALLGLAACSGTTSSELAQALRCAELEAPGAVEFDGRRLVEIPDVASEEMRLANVQLSSGCFAAAQAAVVGRLAVDRYDPEARYVLARYGWITRGSKVGEGLIRDLVDSHPEFVSGSVLLAGLRIDQNRLEEASQILDALEPSAANDVWAWMDRLRIEAMTAPSAALRDKLFAIQSEPGFPPNVREEAGLTLRQTKFVTPEQFEASYALSLEYETSMSFGCKLGNYVAWLMESRGRWDDGIAVVESHLADRDDIRCPGGRLDGFDLMAYATLVKAAQIAPEPGPENAELVARADGYVRGNYSRLGSWVASKPYGRALYPFVAPHMDPAATDRYGHTWICIGVQRPDPDMVRRELERGADPNGRCDGKPLTSYVLPTDREDHVIERRAILSWLLEHGAKRAPTTAPQ